MITRYVLVDKEGDKISTEHLKPEVDYSVKMKSIAFPTKDLTIITLEYLHGGEE